MKINPNEPAFPFWPVAEHRQPDPGLSIRAELAARFMAAMIGDRKSVYEIASRSSNNNTDVPLKDVYEVIAVRSVMAVNALIAELNKPESDETI